MPARIRMKIKGPEVFQDRRVSLAEGLFLLGVSTRDTWDSWKRRGQVKIPWFKDGVNVFFRLSDINKVVNGEETLLYSKDETEARLGTKHGEEK